MSIAPPASRHGLTENEYRLVVDALGREPNATELGMFGAMWSEHCAYKHSRPLLARPAQRRGPGAGGAGRERGRVDIGDGLAVVFKVESHNHPSAIEPYQGAATGVGGIIRDIFTMGARPDRPAQLPALRAAGSGGRSDGGPMRHATRNRHLFGGVVAGIAGYGNCIGIPDVGGEIAFDPGFSGNPLVNAMCVGVARHEDITLARAAGVGNALMLVGAATGRDGIQGASFASAGLDEDSEERRPAVQVGNPFLEKLLDGSLPGAIELRGGGRHAGPGRRGPDLRAGRAVGARRLRCGGAAGPGAGPRSGDDRLRAAPVRVAGANAAGGHGGP